MAAKKRKVRPVPTRLTPVSSPIAGKSIAELLVVAATLMSLPGTLIYLLVIISLQVFEVSLAGNVMAPLLLAAVGLGLCILAATGLFAGLWSSWRRGVIDRLMLLCIWLNGMVLAGLIALMILTPQFR